ncbi:DUF4018 domain-containing protein [Bacillus manliponensis]|uniref:DUF4018 domain-containing protein n=1 Tax=Bacillus manliponensis TaxID=574376 RepID=UPI003518305C
MKTWLRYVNDFVLLLFLYLITEKGETINVFLFLITSYICFMPMQKAKQNKKLYIVLLFALQIFACFTLSLFSTIGSVLLPFFFLLLYIKEDTSPYQKLGGGFIWFCFSIFLNSKFPSLFEAGLFALHILLTLWITSFNRNQQILRVISITTIGLASFLIIPLLPYVRTILSYVLYWVAFGFGYVLNPILEILLGIDRSKADEYVSKLGYGETPPLPEQTKDNSLVLEIITIVVLLLIASYIIWKLYKKRPTIKLSPFVLSEATVAPKYTSVQKQDHLLRPPNNAIRKEIFKLEKKLKSPFNRERGETFEAWMARLQQYEDTDINWDILVDTYHATRYANEENPELLKEFKSEVNKLYAYQKKAKKDR